MNISVRKWKHQDIHLVRGDSFEMTFGSLIVLEDEKSATKYRVNAPDSEPWVFVEAAELRRLRDKVRELDSFQRSILQPVDLDGMTDAERDEHAPSLGLRARAARLRWSIKSRITEELAQIQQAVAELE